RTRRAPLDGPHRGVLGQRGRRIVLVRVQERVLPPTHLRHDRRRTPRRLRMDRRLVQRPPTPFRHRLPQPARVRTPPARTGSLTNQPPVRDPGSTSPRRAAWLNYRTSGLTCRTAFTRTPIAVSLLWWT